MKNKFEIRGDVTVIFVSSKKHGVHEFLIDTNSLKEVSEAVISWHVVVRNKGTLRYVRGKSKESNYKNQILLHRLITKAPADKIVDHINHNTLDNRISNLRVVTQAENMQNRRGAARNNRSSRIRGVTWNKRLKKWQVQVKAGGAAHYFGYYSDLEEAKQAAIKARSKLHPYSVEDIS
ncbi:HNH endonuclease [Paenibacillus cineris]|uniref:HNH endonuclease n=1 Tax=Paenibacillus cineris TaxID=237530 RepID=UPI001B064B1C|nr:HNH endonuclease [Paenibacillus cineris]GIO63557.1 endonuclease [Paenibacillus cineris]